MVIAVIAGIAVLIIVVVLIVRKSAVRLTIAELPPLLTKLRNGADRNGFVGFVGEGPQALYFVYENGTFWLDFEIFVSALEEYAEPFRRVAAELKHDVITTSYDNEHTVLRIKLSSSENEAVEQAYEVAHRWAGIERDTRLQLLP